MPKRRFVFFDVGNTLLFPNRAQILSPLSENKHPTLASWQAIERRTKQEFDAGKVSATGNQGFWRTFHTNLLSQIGGADDGILDRLVENSHQSANWDEILPGTREALERIRQKYVIAVISNADGKIDAVLRRREIFDCFSSITDSGKVGYEKPHPAIFQAALGGLQADPAESLYVGDVYCVDYLGARKAGMQAVLFDVSRAYQGREYPRVESLVELESWLAHQT
jgi:HAD superfamily hydrolase (TIGR01509 family)